VTLDPNASPVRGERALWLACGILFVLAVGLPAIPQDPAYHDFADARTLLGVPNAFDVLSNVFFLAFGLAGLVLHARGRLRYVDHSMRAAGLLLFSGFVLTALGSAYYHWQPSDGRLLWDRLGMVVAFAGVLGMAANQRVSSRAGSLMLVLALVAGVVSVAWFAATGSVTPYAVLQFGGIALVAGLLWRTPRCIGPNWAALIGAYAVAKAFEMADSQIDAISAGVVSGHALKHVVAAFAALAVIVPMRARDPHPG